MRKEYDFSNAIKSPYPAKLKRPVTIRLDQETVEYFKALADELEVPYQTLINMYLRDCASTGRRPSLSWNARRKKAS
jgi:uncharacterized protein (DUF4415 family)